MNIHILNIYRVEDLVKPNQAIQLDRPNTGVVHAITITNERCWIIYEITAELVVPCNSSIEELVCEAALLMTKTIFLTLHRSTTCV